MRRCPRACFCARCSVCHARLLCVCVCVFVFVCAHARARAPCVWRACAWRVLCVRACVRMRTCVHARSLSVAALQRLTRFRWRAVACVHCLCVRLDCARLRAAARSRKGRNAIRRRARDRLSLHSRRAARQRARRAAHSTISGALASTTTTVVCFVWLIFINLLIYSFNWGCFLLFLIIAYLQTHQFSIF